MTERHIGECGMRVPCWLRSHPFAAGPRRHSRDVVEQRHHIAHTGIEIACVVTHSRSVRRALCSLQGQPSQRTLHPRMAVVGERKIRGPGVNQRQLKLFERLLMARRQELLDEAERTVGGMTDSKETFPDPTDRASLESNRNAMLRIRDRERKLLNKIDEALKRISDGSYGLCESCSGPISLDRLKARPVTTLCIDCKSEQEMEERRQRGGM